MRSISTHTSRSHAILCLAAIFSLSICIASPLPQLPSAGGGGGGGGAGGMQASPYEELDPLAAYGVFPLPVQPQQLKQQLKQQELQQQELQQQQGVPTTGPASYMASVTLQQASPDSGSGFGSGSDSGSGMGANPYTTQSIPGTSGIPGAGAGGTDGAQQGGDSDPFTLLREAVDRAAAAIAAASGAAANAAVVEAGVGGGKGQGGGQGQGNDDESGAPGGQAGQGGAGSGAGSGQGGNPGAGAAAGAGAGAGGAPEATQRHKLVSWTDFSKGVAACGQRGDPSYNQGMFLAVDTALGAENVCGKQVLISTKNGKSAVGTVIDLGGTDGSIILSPALFAQFHDLDKGIFHATYTFL